LFQIKAPGLYFPFEKESSIQPTIFKETERKFLLTQLLGNARNVLKKEKNFKKWLSVRTLENMAECVGNSQPCSGCQQTLAEQTTGSEKNVSFTHRPVA